MTAYAYCRVSTPQQQSSGLGIDAQRHSVEVYSSNAGLELTTTFTDSAVSGSVPLEQRRAGSELIATLERRDHVILSRLDRAWRSVPDCLHWVTLWERQEITVHLVDLGLVVGGADLNPMKAWHGRLFLTMLASFAELERVLASERTRTALEQRRAQGLKVGRYAPWGSSVDATGHLQPEWRERDMIRLARTTRQGGMSWTGVTRYLAECGYFDRRGLQMDSSNLAKLCQREHSWDSDST